jgi:hypothetical protein
MDNIRYENLSSVMNKINSYPVSSCEPFIVLSSRLDQTVGHERRVHSHGGMTCIASNMA